MIGDEKLLSLALNASKKASKAILDIYTKINPIVKYKKDSSPVTEADLASNEIIKKELNSQEIPIISEESTIPYLERKELNRFWLVDPLDGTKDFLSKNDEFTINIALIEQNKPILGVIHLPALNEIYYAIRGKNSYLLKNNIKTKLPITFVDHYKIIKSRFHDNKVMKKFERLNNISDSKRAGSALKFCKLATGEINLYPRFVGSQEWDIAAAQIILEKANCSIIDLKTKKAPKYNKRSFVNNHFLAFSNRFDINQFVLPYNL